MKKLMIVLMFISGTAQAAMSGAKTLYVLVREHKHLYNVLLGIDTKEGGVLHSNMKNCDCSLLMDQHGKQWNIVGNAATTESLQEDHNFPPSFVQATFNVRLKSAGLFVNCRANGEHTHTYNIPKVPKNNDNNLFKEHSLAITMTQGLTITSYGNSSLTSLSKVLIATGVVAAGCLAIKIARDRLARKKENTINAQISS